MLVRGQSTPRGARMSDDRLHSSAVRARHKEIYMSTAFIIDEWLGHGYRIHTTVV